MKYFPSIYIFILLYMMSFIMCLNNDDWFLIWLGLEINMMSFIMLIYNRKSKKHIESCFKYFFIQSLGSMMFLSFFYLNKNLLSYLSSLMMSYKMGAGPFYFWFPSVCSGVGWLSCFFLMSFQKMIPLMLMMMFISMIFWVIILFSLFIGVFGSFNQKQMKRLLSYSSIHHVGWMLMCMILDSNIWILYLFLYAVIILGVIMLLMKYEVYSMMNIMKLKYKWMLFIMMLSMAGMPPLLGFFLKWLAFYYIIKMNYMIIIFMLIMSVVMFYIYMRLMYDFMLGLSKKMDLLYYKFYYKYFISYEMFSLWSIFLGCLINFFLIL
uniref:NADH-ubiquinone oxidoreductase chain 2 n=1 Tax=Amaurobius fenestralis TaxID=680006 RepID=A0A7L7S1I4_9ARAC|nr:NADH dehydrogenase subunit 2 [Amaurobius fenestralis]